MKKTLFVIPRAGLCNRMLAISGAVELARRYHMRVVVLWVRDSMLNAKFSDLFDPLPFKVLEFTDEQSLAFKFCYKAIQSLHPVFLISNIEFNNRLYINPEYFDRLKDHHGVLDTYYDVALDEDFSMFRMNRRLQPLLYPKSELQNACGVHLRRTDHKRAIKRSPTSLFIEKMEEDIRRDPSVKFYLATDDPEEEAYFKERFGDRIMTYSKRSLDRNTKTGMEDAVLDLVNLSHCKRLYASYGSTFSRTAAKWGGIDYTVLEIDELTNQ